VLLFLDRNTTETREFFELQTASGSSITLTPSHLLYTVQPESLSPDEQFLFSPNNYILANQTGKLFLDKAVISFAKNVQIGDWVLVKRDSSLNRLETSNDLTLEEDPTNYDIERIVEMGVRVETGVYAPLTSTGNLIVDGVLASCYAVIDDQDLAHYAFLPVRLSHNFVQGISHLWRKFSGFISFKSHAGHSSSSSSSSKAVPTRTPNQSDNRKGRQDQGVHWYADYLYSITKHLLPSHLQYDA
jgi:hedgehog protein